MLKNIDLSRKVSKAEYKPQKEQLQWKLAGLQRKFKALNIPVIIVFEGWNARDGTLRARERSSTV
jgi:polyphosphate kinase 2 (PPK2 family)